MLNRFTGKNIWIIGAASGIGLELVKALSASGANLIVSGRNEQRLKDALDIIGQPASQALPLDTTQPESVARACEKISQKWKHLDYFIYNAGDFEPMESSKLTPISAEKANKIIDVNLKGFISCLGYIIPRFVEQGYGNIAVTASVAGYFGLPKSFAYGASKAALINLAETMRLELSPININVQVINPGFVKTRLLESSNISTPFVISAEDAAEKILQKLGKDIFEIHFPARFSWPLKIMRLLRYEIFFPLVRMISKV